MGILIVSSCSCFFFLSICLVGFFLLSVLCFLMLEATAEIGKKKNRGNMKDDEELEMLLDEIPHATSHNHHHLHQQHDNNHVIGSFHGMCGLMYDDDTSSHYYKHTCASPVSGFSLQSDGSSSSLFSNNGQSLSDNGSPTPPPQIGRAHV